MHKRVFDELFGDCVKIDNVSAEIFARIVKTTAKKYGHDVEIDFSGGKRVVKFKGDADVEKHIIGEVVEMMKKQNTNGEGR